MTAITERPRARADAGTLVEIDKAKQLLYFVDRRAHGVDPQHVDRQR